MSYDAVQLLRRKGLKAPRLEAGLPDGGTPECRSSVELPIRLARICGDLMPRIL